MMILKLFCSIVLVSCCLSRPTKDSLNFFVIGDWGGVPYPPFSTDIEQSVSRKMMDIASAFEVDFLLALGDNFYYNGVENEYDSRFKTSFEDVFNAKDLYFPWYFIAGNHDWHGNVSAQIAYSNHSSRWNYPNYFYTIERVIPGPSSKKMAIIMIDTVLLCGLVSSDFDDYTTYYPMIDKYLTNVYWKFIKDELVRTQSYAYVLVAGHYPVWSVAEHGPTKCLVDQLDPLLKQFNVSAYINGHDHTMEHIQVQYGANQLANYFTIGAANFFSNSHKHNKSVPANSLKFHWKNKEALGGIGAFGATSTALYIEFYTSNGDLFYFSTISPRN